MNKELFRQMHEQMVPSQEVIKHLQAELEDCEPETPLGRFYHTFSPFVFTVCGVFLVLLVIYAGLRSPSPNMGTKTITKQPSPTQITQSINPKAVYHNIKLPEFDFGDYMELPLDYFFEERLTNYMNENHNLQYSWTDSKQNSSIPILAQYLPSGDYTITCRVLTNEQGSSKQSTQNSDILATQLNYIYFNSSTRKPDKIFKVYQFSTKDFDMSKLPKTNQITVNHGNIQIPYIEAPIPGTNTPLTHYLFYQNKDSMIAIEAQADPVFIDTQLETDGVDDDRTMQNYTQIITEMQNLMAGSVEHVLEGNANQDTQKNTSSFHETTAVAMAIIEQPKFPSSSSVTFIKALPSGGKQGTVLNVKFNTGIKQISESEYQITFTKDWGFTFGSTYVKSVWNYRVTRSGVKLIDSTNLDDLPMLMK